MYQPADVLYISEIIKCKILAAVRKNGHIAIATALTSIAATLLKLGMTFHKKNASNEELQLIDFVAYEMIKPYDIISNQFKLLNQYGFLTVENIKIKNISEKILSNYLKERKQKSLYDIDGIIITDNNKHRRSSNSNPKYSFAYKDTYMGMGQSSAYFEEEFHGLSRWCFGYIME